MDGFEEKLNRILSDPAALEKVASIAKGMGAHTERSGSEDAVHEAADGGLGALLGGLGGNGLDPRLMSGIIELMGEYSREDDRRAALLGALRPYVREARREKMDRAVQIVKLARTARAALGMLGGGDGIV